VRLSSGRTPARSENCWYILVWGEDPSLRLMECPISWTAPRCAVSAFSPPEDALPDISRPAIRLLELPLFPLYRPASPRLSS